MDKIKTRSISKKTMDILHCKRQLDYDFSVDHDEDDERHYADMYIMNDGTIYRSQNGLRRSKRMIQRWATPTYFSHLKTKSLVLKKHKVESLDEGVIMSEMEAANIILALKVPHF
jgi:hypothetical protein